MKTSAALLAGLLAGLALGALDRAQPLPTLVSHAQAQEDGFEVGQPPEEEEDEPNPLKGANRKTIKCVVGCQEPYQKCQRGCGKNDEACVDKCGKSLMSCNEGCGVDMQKLVPDDKKKKGSGQDKGHRH
jgi:hypothetical protein